MSEKKGVTKRQHYVPRMLLRNFSSDGKRISLVVDGKRIDNAGLRDQCQEDYFYGSDQILEKSFAEQESEMAALLGDLSPERFETLTDRQLEIMRQFVAYQRARTRGAAQHLSDFMGAFAKQTLKDGLLLNDGRVMTVEEDEAFQVGLEAAQRDAVWQAAKSMPVLADMSVKFIATVRTPAFVVADHPVVAYNQFAEHHPVLSRYPTRTGHALKGLQFFLPVSPSMTLAVYDPATYSYGGNKRVCTAGPHDVALLNRMQAVNAYSCFYFDPTRMTEDALADLAAARRSHPSMFTKHTALGPLQKRGDGTISRIVAVRHAEMALGAKLSFVRTIDGRSYENHRGASIPVRSEELMEVARQLGDLLEAEVTRRREVAGVDGGEVAEDAHASDR